MSAIKIFQAEDLATLEKGINEWLKNDIKVIYITHFFGMGMNPDTKEHFEVFTAYILYKASEEEEDKPPRMTLF